jgi:hypothetical protein
MSFSRSFCVFMSFFGVFSFMLLGHGCFLNVLIFGFWAEIVKP